MSSPSDRADSAPAPSADPPSTSDAKAAEQQPARHGSTIRIGTQRYGTKPPPAVAKPVLPAPPAELMARAAALSASPRHAAAPTAQAAPAEPAAASSATDAGAANAGSSDASASPTAAGPAEPVEPSAASAPPAPAGRPKRPGQQKPRERRVPVEPQQTRRFPPPNTRAQLSEDLEMEFIEALGGQSVDEMIAGSGGEVAAELEVESRHKGKVVSIHRDNVFLEIGGHQQGLLQLKNFAEPPEPGTVLDVMVSRFNAADGFYELVLPGATIDVADWSEVAEGMVVEARVTGHNKGGLECEVNRLRGFIPASQISMYRVEDLAQFVDQKFACVITEANPEKRNLVLSRRAMLEREKAEAKEKLMAELEVGQIREGVVRSLQAFGAFVDLGGVDGLIHISQLSWDRVKHASEVLQAGQTVKVKIQKIDPQTGKIGLAFRDMTESPWANAVRDFPTRTTVHGTVSRLMEFGAFVRLAAGVEGLVHISELSHRRVFRVSDVLTEGQEVDVLVLSVDAEQQRISLSLKALEARAAPAEKAEPEPAEPDVPAAPARPRKTPLKGGIGGPPSGDKFGLKW